MSQRRMSRSEPPETRRLSSGRTMSALTKSICASSTLARSSPVCAFCHCHHVMPMRGNAPLHPRPEATCPRIQ